MQTTKSQQAGERTQLKLSDLINQSVTVQNVAYEQMEDGKLQIKLEGTLEAPVDGDYYLRVKECYNGTSGISFNERHLDRENGIDNSNPSGRVTITLK